MFSGGRERVHLERIGQNEFSSHIYILSGELTD